MNKGWKSALAVLALAGSALSAPVVAQSYGPDTVGPSTNGPPANPYPPQGGYGPQNNYPPQDNGYGDPNYSRGYAPDDPYAPLADPYSSGPYASGDPYAPYPNYAPPPGGIGFSYDSGGYCDAWGCPDDYWDMPIFYGPVFFGGTWYDGPVYYRDGYGGRQFWIHGGWHGDEWRGPRPNWWHAGRVGPALGVNFYRSHGFQGRSDNARSFNNSGGFNNGGRFDNGGRGFNPPGRRDFGQRGNFAGRNVQQAAPQNNRGGGFANFQGGQQQVQQQTSQSHGGDRGGRQASNGGGHSGGHSDGGHGGGDHHRR
jgi:hypothetical protein